MGRRLTLKRCAALSRCCHSNAFIEARVSGQVFGDGIHPCRVQYSKGFPPHIFERQAASNAIIGKQFENLATFRHVGIRGRPEIVNQLLSGVPGIVGMLSDVMKKALGSGCHAVFGNGAE